MEPEIWGYIITGIVSILGSGGAVKIYDKYLANKRRTDAEYVSDHFRSYIEEMEGQHKSLLKKYIRLEEQNEVIQQRCMDLLTENVKLKGRLNQCLPQQDQSSGF